LELWGLFSYEGLGWLSIGGHQRLMIDYLGPLPTRWFAATKFKVLRVKYKSRGIFLKFIEE